MKHYSKFLDAGRDYYLEGSYYNAINILEKGLNNGHYSLSDRINSLRYIAESYFNLGLLSKAMFSIEKAIDIYESHKYRREWFSHEHTFAIKAKILFCTKKFDEAELECRKNAAECALGNKILSEILIKKGEIDEGLKAYIKYRSKSGIRNYKDENSYIIDLLCEIGAIEEICRFITTKTIEETDMLFLSQISKKLFLIGDLKNANTFKEKLSTLYFEKYNKPLNLDFNNVKNSSYKGIVNYLDVNKGFGFILSASSVHKFDTIYFNITPLIKKLKVGDFVNFNIKTYFDSNKIPKRVAQNIEIKSEPTLFIPWRASKDGDLKRVFHGLVFKDKPNLRLGHNLIILNIFYPYEIFISLNQIIEKIPPQLSEELNEKNYIFVEIQLGKDLTVSADNILWFRKLGTNNSYVDKIVQSTNKSYESDIQRVKIDFNASPCIICGETEWCGTGGCPKDFT